MIFLSINFTFLTSNNSINSKMQSMNRNPPYFSILTPKKAEICQKKSKIGQKIKRKM